MILWSPQAELDFHSNIEYLLENWSAKEASYFIECTETVLSIIERVPMSFRPLGFKNIRAAVILPQITLYYRLNDDNDIELIRFWNNTQNPERLKL